MSVCHVCGVSENKFSRKYLFEDHVKSHQGIKFVCYFCGKSFSEYYAFLNHQSKYHSSIRFACEECGKQFTNKSSLKRHMDMHQRSSDHVCEICSKSFAGIDHLKRNQENEFLIPYSSKAYQRKGTLL